MMARKRKIIAPVIEEAQTVKESAKNSPKKQDYKRDLFNKKTPIISAAKTIQQYSKIPIKKKRPLPKINSDSEGEEIGEKKTSTLRKLQTSAPKVENFETLSKEIDMSQKGLIFHTALGSSSMSPKKTLEFQSISDELYNHRLMPHIDGMPNV